MGSKEGLGFGARSTSRACLEYVPHVDSMHNSHIELGIAVAYVEGSRAGLIVGGEVAEGQATRPRRAFLFHA